MSGNKIKNLSPAKINLMLRVLAQKENGYHNLQTYFLILNWGDLIEYHFNNSSEIQINGNFPNLQVEDNLIFKAIKAIQPYQKLKSGITINVAKHIPQGSGLGGGSSNAATTLKVLNKQWKCNLTTKQLMDIGKKLGADVPIFILNQSAMAEGIGEILTPHSIGQHWVVLIFPQVPVETAQIFNRPNLKRNQSKISIQEVSKRKNWINDCTPVVLDLFKEIDNCYKFASQHSEVYMSGTGSTLFSVFTNESEAKIFQNKLSLKYKTQICQNKA